MAVLLAVTKVLIPFKAGQWFKQKQKALFETAKNVLIPFKAGQWFKHTAHQRLA